MLEIDLLREASIQQLIFLFQGYNQAQSFWEKNRDTQTYLRPIHSILKLLLGRRSNKPLLERLFVHSFSIVQDKNQLLLSPIFELL